MDGIWKRLGLGAVAIFALSLGSGTTVWANHPAAPREHIEAQRQRVQADRQQVHGDRGNVRIDRQNLRGAATKADRVYFRGKLHEDRLTLNRDRAVLRVDRNHLRYDQGKHAPTGGGGVDAGDVAKGAACPVCGFFGLNRNK